MNDNLTKIQRNLSDVAMSDLQRWIVQSLKQKTVIQYKGLRLEAGFATYNRWQRIVYDEPRTRQRRVNGPFGTWTYVPEVYTARVEKKVPLPNWNQFYLRYKLVPVASGGSASSSSPPSSAGGHPSVGRLLINNNYSGDVTIRLYHPQSPGRIFSSWRIARNKQTFLALNNRDINIAGDWKTDIVFGNGVASSSKSIGQVGSFVNGAWRVDATRIYSGG